MVKSGSARSFRELCQRLDGVLGDRPWQLVVQARDSDSQTRATPEGPGHSAMWEWGGQEVGNRR